MRPSLTFTYNQHLKFAPKLTQSIRLLQLSTQMLDLEIQNLLDKNPLLEIETENAETNLNSESNVQEDNINENITSENNERENLENEAIDNRIEIGEILRSEEKDQEYQEWLYNRHNETSLKQHLLWQMNTGNFGPCERIIGATIIDAINDEGYLSISLQEILENLNLQYPDHKNFDLNEIECVLHKIQNFEPVGVAARDLTECLFLQMVSLPKKTPYLNQAKNTLKYLNLIAERNFYILQKKLKLSNTELENILHLIRSLNPKPGSKYLNLSGNYIIPDLKIIKKKGFFYAELNSHLLPKLRLNPDYLTWIKRMGSSRVNESLKDHFVEARNFLKALQIRNQTLLKVASHITTHQQDFFKYGEEYLQPLNLNTIASECNLHESTVSRITTQKFIETPQGLFELKYFFATKINKDENKSNKEKGDNKHLCNKAIRAKVKKIIAGESPLCPLSDAKISMMLKDEGIQISRRTVTKYREQMKISSSHDRYTFFKHRNGVK